MWTLNMSIKKSERSDSSSLQLLWYIGGTPPVLRNGTKFVRAYQEKIFGTKNSSSLKRRRRTVSSLASSFYFTILASLCLFISPCQANQSCHRLQQEDIPVSDVVTLASVVSRSRSVHGQYSATFQCHKLYQNKYDEDLSSKYIRLKINPQQFRDKNCKFSKVKPNSKYLLMLKKDVKGLTTQYTLIQHPVKYKRKTLSELDRLFCPDCDSDKERVRVRRGKQRRGDTINKINKINTRLSCSARGNPPPTLYWTMDGKKIKNSASTRIITKNLSKFLRKSILKLKPSVTNKSVKLQCHAYNEYGHTSQVKMTKPREIKSGGRYLKGLRSHKGISSGLHRLHYNHGHSKKILIPNMDETAERSKSSRYSSPLYSSSCPIPEFCLNGGTCQYFSTIGEQTCHCSKGYHGQRCERKYVDTGSRGTRISDKFPMCLLGMAHYPCI